MFGPFDWILLIAGGIALLLLLPFVLGPLLIYSTHKQAALPELEPFLPGQTPLPANVDRYFSQACWALNAEGFEIISGMFLPRQIEHVIGALIMLANRRDRDTVIVVALHADPPGGTPMTQMHVEVVTRYRDGRIVQTGNPQQLSAFPPPPNCVNSFFPSIAEAAQLYRLHRAITQRHGSGEKILRLDDDFAGDSVRYMQFSLIEELNHACEAGYMRLDRAAGVYRPTVKGATIMIWQEMWPFKSIRIARRARNERRLLEELAFHAPVMAAK
jgi:hypothetical protein